MTFKQKVLFVLLLKDLNSSPMFKRTVLILLLTLFGFHANSQILDPVDWEISTKKIDDTSFELIFTASMDLGWAIYSQDVEEGGPIPTSIEFYNTENVEFNESVIESDLNKVTKHDPIFDMVIPKFFDQAIFTQHLKFTSKSGKISGAITYMTCDDEQCILGTEETFSFSYSLENGLVAVNEVAITDSNNLEASESVNTFLYGMEPEDMTTISTIIENKSLWSIFGLGFLGGLIALLTPCVFPMIPLTVSFFTKKGDNKSNSGIGKATLYGFFILAVYLILSIPFHLLDSVNPDILNDISTNVWLNIIFFLIFLFFAFSFFGYYELTLPSSWTEKTTKGENVGGIIGVFFMALTLALVSFSCTGPILGSLLAGSLTADGGAMQLTAGMGGFGLALGLPFAVFAMFPSMMNTLPKSGGWLNTVKVVLGFLELALALKFLSNADLVKHWGLLKIEVFLGLWILIFAGLVLYLFGKIKFPHDSPIKKLSFSRVSFAVLFLAFTIYLASGFRVNKRTNTFVPLTLLSGLAPPVGYSIFLPNDTPNDLNSFKDFKEGIAYAQQVGKPILLDFTGHACVNCRKMEEHIWPLDKIDNYIRNEYILISLYVDDKRELPEHEKVSVKRVNGGTRQLENYGHKWANFQTQFFQSNSQPYYVLLSSDGKTVLNEPVGYTPDEDEYAVFLESGLESFKSTAAQPTLNFK
jgi:thiol:disulfide interchange protein DsbD